MDIDSIWRGMIMNDSEKPKGEKVICKAHSKNRGCPIAEGCCQGEACEIVRPGE